MTKIENEKGAIVISSDVFASLVGEAAVNCFGVKGMAMRSMSDGLVHLLKRESMKKGVYIRYDEDNGITIELHIIIDQGVNITALCRSIISEVRYKVSAATGANIQSVDIFIDSITLD
jgi:uncharacterized alkaline shock family protein YloU